MPQDISISNEILVAIAPESFSGAIQPLLANEKSLKECQITGKAFATSWQVNIIADLGFDDKVIEEEIKEILILIDEEMSVFREDSFISRLNNAKKGASFTMPSDFANVLAGAIEIAQKSDGKFDPCVWDAVQEWGFGFKKVEAEGPDEYEINRLKKLPDWQDLRIQDGKITKTEGLKLDFSAIAKGYAVDKVLQKLKTNGGIYSALVEIGGELKAFGIRPDDMPWWIDVKNTNPLLRLALYNFAIATSGDTYRNFKKDGKTYSHTINPKTSAPVETDISFVSVIDKDCWRADALATALMVMGKDAALAFSNKNRIPCIMVLNDGTQYLNKILTEWCG